MGVLSEREARALNEALRPRESPHQRAVDSLIPFFEIAGRSIGERKAVARAFRIIADLIDPEHTEEESTDE